MDALYLTKHGFVSGLSWYPLIEKSVLDQILDPPGISQSKGTDSSLNHNLNQRHLSMHRMGNRLEREIAYGVDLFQSQVPRTNRYPVYFHVPFVYVKELKWDYFEPILFFSNLNLYFPPVSSLNLGKEHFATLHD